VRDPYTYSVCLCLTSSVLTSEVLRMTDLLDVGDLSHDDVPGSLKSILEDIAA
jgi:hypothetical protein